MKSLVTSRLEFVDCLKVILILCVLFNHLPEYAGIKVSRTFWSELGGIGVSGFIVMSGFGLTYGSLVKNITAIPLLPFFWKRFSRIGPLYYAALFTFIALVDLVQSKNLLAHLFFVHTFFRYFSHYPGSLWFVGLVVQCYLVFPLAYQLLRQPKGTRLLMIVALGIYSLGLALQLQGFYVRDSILIFSVEFSLGMILAASIHGQGNLRRLKSSIFSLLLIELTGFFALVNSSFLYELPDALVFPIRTLSRLCFFGIALNIVLLLEQKWTPFKALSPLFSVMSFASYSVYLFHRPILSVITQGPGWTWVSDRLFGESAYLQLATLVMIMIPILFVMGYWIQICHDSIWNSQFWSTLRVRKALSVAKDRT